MTHVVVVVVSSPVSQRLQQRQTLPSHAAVVDREQPVFSRGERHHPRVTLACAPVVNMNMMMSSKHRCWRWLSSACGNFRN